MPLRIDRDDLYLEIWSSPATKLAKRYDVSSSYLARVCEALNVPHPPRGYWARRAAGETIAVPPLPPASAGDPLSWEKGEALLERLPQVNLSARQESPVRPTRRVKLTQHPLVTAWREHSEGARSTEAGYLASRKRNVLDAFVTKAIVGGTADTLNAIFIELEQRGCSVRLSIDHSHRRPLVDVKQAPIRDEYAYRANEWQPGRPTVAYVGRAIIGLTIFELMEHVRVRRTGSDRYVRIGDLPAVRRYAPQSPDEEDSMRDMPTGRLVLRAYSAPYDMKWSHEWTEERAGELGTMVKDVADFLQEIEPVLVKEADEAEQRQREYDIRVEAEISRRQAEERAEARKRARQAARENLESIVAAWHRAYAVEAFFAELSHRAEALHAEERSQLEARIVTARRLMGGQDAVEQFLQWRMPKGIEIPPEDS